MIPEALRAFVRLFNRGEYWESHEVLEGPWRREGSRFYHGLILYASAFVHARRGNAHGVRAQLEKAEGALEPFRPHYLGVDVSALLEHGIRCRTLVGEEEEPAAEAWAGEIEFPVIALAEGRVRGDEPELAPPEARGA